MNILPKNLITTMTSNNISNIHSSNSHADGLNDDLVQVPEEMRLFTISQHINNNPNIVLPPNAFRYATIVKNPTVFPTRPFYIEYSYSLLISLCEPVGLVLTIQKELKDIIRINNLTYCDKSKQWKFSYDKPRKYLQSMHQISVYHAAVTAFYKFPPENLEIEDIRRISDYKTLVGLYEDHIDTRLPYANFILTLWYNPEQKNIIMELIKLRCCYDEESYLTANFIRDKLNKALIADGFEVSPYKKIFHS